MITHHHQKLTDQEFERYQRTGWLWTPTPWHPITRELHEMCCLHRVPFVVVSARGRSCQIEASVSSLAGENPFTSQPQLAPAAMDRITRLAQQALSSSPMRGVAKRQWVDGTSVKVEGLRVESAMRLARQVYDVLAHPTSYGTSDGE